MKTLSIVATPIGNLSDITLRAIETLKEADLIIAEDTRRTKILLEHYKISGKKLVSFHAQSTEAQAENLFKKSEQKNLVYVSDAGTPGISDPGYRLIQAARKQDIRLIPIPGPSALTTLVSVAGIPVDSFFFLGFLPHKKGRKTIFEQIKEANHTTGFYESVHRFPRFLEEANEYLGGERIIVVGRELTKMHEEIFRGTVHESQEFFSKENTKGEFVVLVAPKKFSF